MGFNSQDDLINEITSNGKFIEWNFRKYHPAALEGAGVWHSIWKAPGSPGAGVDPAGTPGTAYDDAAGSMNWTDVDPDTKHSLVLEAVSDVDCVLMVVDRLVSVGGISMVGTGPKTIDSTALPRYSGTDATNVEAWLEVTTAGTGGPPLITMNSYTNEAGATGHAGAQIALPSTPAVHSMYNFGLQAGDKGIRSVETVNVDTAGTAGVFNVTLLRPIGWINLYSNQLNNKDFVNQFASMRRIFDSASLALMVLASSTTAPNIWGCLSGAYG